VVAADRDPSGSDAPPSPDALDPGRADPESYYPGSLGRPHPGPASVSLPRAIREAIVAEARDAIPNEACGIVIGDRAAADGGRALRWVPLANASASPYRYSIDPADLLQLTIETDDAGEVFWAIVHSHVASPARPSPTDVRESHYPDVLYVVLSLDPREADPQTGEPGLRAWRIVDGGVHEVRLVIREGDG
jgi:[CysO sulfur-carrier protein]-S-L-cysteine hydrolase